MKITGKNLELVAQGLQLGVDELHNQIAMCPDVNMFAAELDAIEEQKTVLSKLLDRVLEAIEAEQKSSS